MLSQRACSVNSNAGRASVLSAATAAAAAAAALRDMALVSSLFWCSYMELVSTQVAVDPKDADHKL